MLAGYNLSSSPAVASAESSVGLSALTALSKTSSSWASTFELPLLAMSGCRSMRAPHLAIVMAATAGELGCEAVVKVVTNPFDKKRAGEA